MNDEFWPATVEVEEMSKLHISGNVTPPMWYKRITFENGAVDFLSIAILSELVFWYRAIELRNEETGEPLPPRRKFKGRYLQKNKKSLAQQFNVSERQIKDSLYRLEKMGLIERIYEHLKAPDGTILGLLLYIKIFPKKIAQLSYYNELTEEKFPPDVSTSDGGFSHPNDVSTSTIRRFNVDTLDGQTSNAHIGTEITTEITTENIYTREKNPSSRQKSKTRRSAAPEKPLKIPKVEVAPAVFLTEDERQSLLKAHGEDFVNLMLSTLSSYKESSGKAYKKDSALMREGGWVFEKAKEKMKALKLEKPPEKTYDPANSSDHIPELMRMTVEQRIACKATVNRYFYNAIWTRGEREKRPDMKLGYLIIEEDGSIFGPVTEENVEK